MKTQHLTINVTRQTTAWGDRPNFIQSSYSCPTSSSHCTEQFMRNHPIPHPPSSGTMKDIDFRFRTTGNGDAFVILLRRHMPCPEYEIKAWNWNDPVQPNILGHFIRIQTHYPALSLSASSSSSSAPPVDCLPIIVALELVGASSFCVSLMSVN